MYESLATTECMNGKSLNVWIIGYYRMYEWKIIECMNQWLLQNVWMVNHWVCESLDTTECMNGKSLNVWIIGYFRMYEWKIIECMNHWILQNVWMENHWLYESMATTECMNGEQMPWYFVHAQDDLNLHILHMLKVTFLPNLAHIPITDMAFRQLTLVLLNKLRCLANFWFSANQITWSVLLL